MSLHILPVAVPRNIVETRGLFLAREAVNCGAISPTWEKMVEQLAQSDNAAVANEARRMLAARPLVYAR